MSTLFRFRFVATALLLCGLIGMAGGSYSVGIEQLSTVYEGRRYYCLNDDAMISMRFADNLAAGHGLVWNPGEYVQGYTNLGWTLWMALSLIHICRCRRRENVYLCGRCWQL